MRGCIHTGMLPKRGFQVTLALCWPWSPAGAPIRILHVACMCIISITADCSPLKFSMSAPGVSFPSPGSYLPTVET